MKKEKAASVDRAGKELFAMKPVKKGFMVTVAIVYVAVKMVAHVNT